MKTIYSNIHISREEDGGTTQRQINAGCCEHEAAGGGSEHTLGLDVGQGAAGAADGAY
jgi:hypothetical protein